MFGDKAIIKFSYRGVGGIHTFMYLVVLHKGGDIPNDIGVVQLLQEREREEWNVIISQWKTLNNKYYANLQQINFLDAVLACLGIDHVKDL